MSLGEVEKKRNTGGIIALVFFLVLVVGVTIFCVNIFNEKATYTGGGNENTKSASLYCKTKSNNIDGAFFDVSKAESAEQVVKAIFKNNKINDISYNATLIYADEDTAKQAEAVLNFGYGTYAHDNGGDRENFSPNFSVNGPKVKISLFATMKQLNPALAKIFLIDTDDTNLDRYTPKVLATLYKTKGFTCEAKE